MSASRDDRRFDLKSFAISVLDRLIATNVLAAYLYLWARLVVFVRKPIIIGVTGSVGKSTTIEMIASVLKQPEVESLVGEVDKPRTI